MPTPLVIIGAGGFSRETAEAVRAVNSLAPTWELLGFADDDRSRAGTRIENVDVLGPIDEVVSKYAQAQLVVCTGRPDNYFSRARIVARIKQPEERFATLIHPAASVASSCVVGVGTVILAGTVVTAASTIGRHVAVMPACVITHDDSIADYVTIASGTRLGGSVTVGRGAYLGAGVLVREELSVGEWAMIGMGSLVTKSVPAGERWYGFPARQHGTVEVPADLR
jgi:sugar O-acyltransferase (sialic acid O-acetyltransferase NeuD family)